MSKKFSRATAALGIALFVAPITALGGVATPSIAGASTSTHLLTCSGFAITKPAAYTLSCADAGAGFNTMTWTRWSNTSATGSGVLRQNNCVPNCVGGTFLDYRATVTLSKVVETKKYGALFSKATFHYIKGGKTRTEVFSLAD